MKCFIFYINFLWWAGNWMLSTQTFVNESSFDEGFSCAEAATGGVLLKRGVFRNFTKFTGKHLCQKLLFSKAASLQLC